MVISTQEVSTQREVKPMNNIASERVKHNLTQEGLAERLGVGVENHSELGEGRDFRPVQQGLRDGADVRLLRRLPVWSD